MVVKQVGWWLEMMPSHRMMEKFQLPQISHLLPSDITSKPTPINGLHINNSL
jgi:hypothetical protein